jgi:hypothetical protein
MGGYYVLFVVIQNLVKICMNNISNCCITYSIHNIGHMFAKKKMLMH